MEKFVVANDKFQGAGRSKIFFSVAEQQLLRLSTRLVLPEVAGLLLPVLQMF